MIDRLHFGRRFAWSLCCVAILLGVSNLLRPPPPTMAAAIQACDQAIGKQYPRIIASGQYRLERSGSRNWLALSRFPNFRYSVFSRVNHTRQGRAECSYWVDARNPDATGYRVTYFTSSLSDLERRTPACLPQAGTLDHSSVPPGDAAGAADCGRAPSP